MWSKGFWKATAERVIASIAGGALAVMGNELFNVLELDFQQTAGIALGAGLVSLLKALAAGAKDGNPSAISAEAVTGGPAAPGRHSDTADRLDP